MCNIYYERGRGRILIDHILRLDLIPKPEICRSVSRHQISLQKRDFSQMRLKNGRFRVSKCGNIKWTSCTVSRRETPFQDLNKYNVYVSELKIFLPFQSVLRAIQLMSRPRIYRLHTPTKMPLKLIYKRLASSTTLKRRIGNPTWTMRLTRVCQEIIRTSKSLYDGIAQLFL